MIRSLLCVLCLGVPLPTLAEELSQGDIRAELVGTSIEWWEDGGWRHGFLYLSPDGRAEIDLAGPDRGMDTGRWQLRGDSLCTAWSGLRDGGEKCYRISRAEAGRFVTSGGNVFALVNSGV